MFKAENTGMPAWKRIVDSNGKAIADLDETYSSDWILVKINSRDLIVDDTFSNGSRAASWLWKNRALLGEPFSSYPDEKKVKKVSNIPEPEEEIVESTVEDLFRDLIKPMRA